jgi:hypothetical protein
VLGRPGKAEDILKKVIDFELTFYRIGGVKIDSGSCELQKSVTPALG